MPTTRRNFLSLATATAIAAPAVHVSGAAVDDRIKIGQIGTKHAHASGKMESMRGLEDLYEVVGIVEPDEARRKAIQSQRAYQGLPFLDERALLDTPGLAAVAVETSVDELVPTGLRCIAAGKHIHLDKPAGTNLSDCRRLHRAADERDLTIQMGYMLRYNPAFVTLSEVVDQGWLGPITEVSAAMGKRASDALRKELAVYPGGGMFELACHVIDAMIGILGKPQSVNSHVRRSYPDKDPFADNQLAVFEYPHALATVRCNHLDPFGFPRRFFEVSGEQGTFLINPLEPPQAKLFVDRRRGEYDKGTHKLQFARPTGRYDGEFRDLARVIRGEKRLRWDSDHDLAVQETILRASGMPVD